MRLSDDSNHSTICISICLLLDLNMSTSIYHFRTLKWEEIYDSACKFLGVDFFFLFDTNSSRRLSWLSDRHERNPGNKMDFSFGPLSE